MKQKICQESECFECKCGKIYASRSVSLKMPSAEGCGEGTSVVAFVGALAIGGWTGWKGFQGLEGQWNGFLFTSSAVPVAEVGLEAVVSSSDDSLTEAIVGAAAGATECLVMEGGTSYRRFLSGDQPGGRRLLKP